MKPLIRSARMEDAPALAELKRSTFRETFIEDFAIPYPPDDLALFEEANYGLARIKTELGDGARRTLVVEDEGRLIGYAHYGPCKLPHPEVRPGEGELYQLYFRRAAQGRGLGKQLLTMVLDGLAADFPGPHWLGVWSGNLRAQAVYAAHAFEKVGDYRFPVGNWYDEEFIFRRAATMA